MIRIFATFFFAGFLPFFIFALGMLITKNAFLHIYGFLYFGFFQETKNFWIVVGGYALLHTLFFHKNLLITILTSGFLGLVFYILFQKGYGDPAGEVRWFAVAAVIFLLLLLPFFFFGNKKEVINWEEEITEKDPPEYIR